MIVALCTPNSRAASAALFLLCLTICFCVGHDAGRLELGLLIEDQGEQDQAVA